jgi:hypothetical protein
MKNLQEIIVSLQKLAELSSQSKSLEKDVRGRITDSIYGKNKHFTEAKLGDLIRIASELTV